jgi:hypothetical protein
MKNYFKQFHRHVHLLTCVLALSACGGSGSGSSTSVAPVSAAPSSSKSTPMTALVVPVAMKWGTTSVFALGFNVKEASGVAAAGVPVGLYTFTNVSLEDGSPLDEPVALDQIDSSITDADGVATFSARLPGFMTELLIVSSKGAATAKKVISLTGDMPAVTITLGL